MGEELQAELGEIVANARLSELYLALARDLDVMEPKLPEEVRARSGSHVQRGSRGRALRAMICPLAAHAR
jgi:hypothetical protein